MACEMPEPCKFPSPDNCQKRSLGTPIDVDHALHPVVGLVNHIRDAEKFPQKRRAGEEGKVQLRIHFHSQVLSGKQQHVEEQDRKWRVS